MEFLRRWVSVGLLLYGALLVATPAEATSVRTEGAVVFVNEVPVFRVRTSNKSLSSIERARLAATRLSEVTSPLGFSVIADGKDRVITHQGGRIITLTSRDAAVNRLSLPKLADQMIARLKSALELPPLRTIDSFTRIPINGGQRLQVVGYEASAAKLEVRPAGIISVSKSGSEIKVQAQNIGRTTISIMGETSMETIDVEVLPWAANLPQTLSATVTGAPATATTVKGALEAALRTRLKALPEAKWTFKLPKATALGSGKSRSFGVRVSAEAPGSFASTGIVTVIVKNLAVDRVSDSQLWYSNDPESVKVPGGLFCAALKPGSSTRLLYHHMNAANQALFLRIQAVNESDTPARVVIIPGDSQPDRNPVRAGVTAADQFVRNWIYGSGEVVTIPAHSTLPVILRRLLPGETLSGLCSLRLLDGPSQVMVRTDAWPPFPLDAAWNSALYSSTPWREVGTHPIGQFDQAPFEISQHIYPNPTKAEQMSYMVGGRYSFLRIGQHPVAREDGDGALDGNFGVIYNIKAKLQNLTQQAADVELVFEASAGYTGGLFILNGSYLKTPLLLPKTETRLYRVRLSPGAQQYLDITTIPLSGSSYPATLTIRPVQTITQGLAGAVGSR